MTFLEFRTQNGLTQAIAAAGIGVTDVAVSHYENGRRIPKPTVMARIVAFTDGKVTPNDFHGVP